MSDVDFRFLQPTSEDIRKALSYNDRLSKDPLGPDDKINYFAGTTLEQANVGTLDYVIAGLQLPEEIFTKLVGNLVSNDPKYDWGTGRVGDQVGYADLFGDTGMHPVLAAMLGLVVAIANPLDPLNKIKLGALTAKGVQTERVAKLYANQRNIFNVAKNGLAQINIKPIEQAIARASSEAASLSAAGKVEDAAVAERRIRLLGQELAEKEQLNEFIAAAHKDGVGIEDIQLAATRADQIAGGQRSLVGLTKPTSMDHLSLFGLAKDPLDHAAQSVVTGGISPRGLPYVPELSASFVRGVSSVGKFAKTMLEKGADVLTNTTGYHFVGHHADLVRKVDAVVDAYGFVEQESLARLSDILHTAKERGVSPEQFSEMYREFHSFSEDVAKSRAVTEAINNAASVLTDAKPRGPKLVNADELAGARRGIDPTTGTPLYPNTELSRGEIDEALGEWAQGTPKHLGKRGRLMSSKYVVLNNAETLDEDVLRALRDVEGAVGFEYAPSGTLDEAVQRVVEQSTTKQEALALIKKAWKANTTPSIKVSPTDLDKLFKDAENALLDAYGHTKEGIEEAARAVAKIYEPYDVEYGYQQAKFALESRWGRPRDPIGLDVVVGKRPVGTRPIATLFNGDATRVLYGPEHHRSMEVLAAQLTARNLGFARALRANDFIATDDGRIFLINPDAVARTSAFDGKLAKSVDMDLALSNKQKVMEFALNHGHAINEAQTPSILDGKRAIKNAAATAKIKRERRLNLTPGNKDEALKTVDARQLMLEANNTLFHEQFLYGGGDEILQELYDTTGPLARERFAVANDIGAKFKTIKEALERGDSVPLEPITVGVTKDGRLEIIRGRNDLTAAILNDVTHVQVRVDDLANQWIDSKEPFIFSDLKMRDVFLRDNAEFAGNGFFRTVNTAEPSPVALDYKNFSGGKYYNITKGDLSYKHGAAGQFRGKENVIDATTDIFSRGSVGQVLPTAKKRVLAAIAKRRSNHYVRPHGHIDDQLELEFAAIDLSELLIQSPDVKTFMARMQELYAGPGASFVPNIGKGRNIEFLTEQFERAKTLAQDHLNTLASRGVFSPAMLGDELASSPFVAVYKRGIIERFNFQTNRYEVHSSVATVDMLKEHVKKQLNNDVTADQIVPFDVVDVSGADGKESLIINDFVTNHKARIADQIQWRRNTVISDKKIAALADKGVYYEPYNGEIKLTTDGKPRLTDHRPIERVAGEYPTYDRQVHSYFYTDSGRLFVDTRQTTSGSVGHLLRTVYGESTIPRGEFGYITSDKVALNYPVTNIDVLTPRTVKQLGNRLTEVARSLIKAGYHPNLKVEVVTDIPGEVWGQMFNRDATIGMLANESRHKWLYLPTELKDAVFPKAMGRPVILKPPKGRQNFKYGPDKWDIIKRVADEITGIGDEEILNGLSFDMRSVYMPRVRTPDGDRAMMAMSELLNGPGAAQVFKDNKTMSSLVAKFMRGRVLPDIPTDELNQFIEKLRKYDPNIATSDDLWNEVVKSVGERNAKTLHYLARSMNAAEIAEGSPFFYNTLPMSMVRRIQESAQVTRKKLILDTLTAADSPAVELTTGSLSDYRKAVKNIATQRAVTTKALSAVADAEAELEKLVKYAGADANDVENARRAVEARKVDHGNELVKLGDLERELVVNHGKIAQLSEIDLDAPMWYIDSKAAQRLLNERKIKVSDLHGTLDNGLVALPSGLIRASLPKETKIYMFPRDMLGVVERYFGSMTPSTGTARKLLNIWDTATDAWRSWTLFSIPAYHIRNAVSNTFLMWLGGYGSVEGLRSARVVMAQLGKFRAGKSTYADTIKAFREATLRNDYYQDATIYDLYSEAVKNGVFTGGQHYNEFHFATKALKKVGAVEQLFARHGIVPSSELVGNFWVDNKALRVGKNFGQSIENFYRLATFIDAWKKTGDFAKAGQEVRKIFYDYRNLSQFERRFMRRVMPFYTWSRFNIPRMIETMFTKPITHYRITSLFRSLERQSAGGGPVNEEELPQWVKDRFGVVVEKTNGIYWVRTLDTLVPAYEAYGFFVNGPINEGASRVTEGISPILKMPYEIWLNKSGYTGRELQTVPGQPASGFVASKLGMTRAPTSEGSLGVLNAIWNEYTVKSVARLPSVIFDLLDASLDSRVKAQTRPRVLAGFIDALLGKAYAVDPVQTRAAFYADKKRNFNVLRGLYRSAAANGDEVAANFYQGLINQFTLTAPPEENE